MSTLTKHIVWVMNQKDCPHLLTTQFKNTSSTLLYNPLSKKAHRLFEHFDAAFPLVDLPLQISSLEPDLVFLLSPSKQMPITNIPIVQYDPKTAPSMIESLKPKQKQPPPVPESVGLIIRSYNDACIIEQTLKGVQSQDIKIDQVIVADSQSTDGTREIIKKYGYPIFDIQSKDYFPGKVLNQAAEKLNTEFMLFINSDAVPLTNSTFREILKPFIDTQVSATYARQIPRPDADAWVFRDYQTAFPPSEAPSWMYLSLSHAAMRRSVYEQHPFYTEAWGSEDAEWGVWAQSNGFLVKYVPKSLVMHSHNYTLKQLYGRKFIEGEADVFIHNKQYTLIELGLDCVKSALRDFIYCIKLKKFKELLTTPIRRIVYYWGYYKGNRHGTQRIREGNQDASVGQKTVLKRHKP